MDLFFTKLMLFIQKMHHFIILLTLIYYPSIWNSIEVLKLSITNKYNCPGTANS